MTGREVTEIADGVFWLPVGAGLLPANVYFVGARDSWVLIDSGWPGSAAAIRSVAQSLFGPAARPDALLITHLHTDHAGSARELAQLWGLTVRLHPAEMPLARGEYLPEYANPLDRRLGRLVTRVLPRTARERRQVAGRLTDIIEAYDPLAPAPGAPDWVCIHSPGHTPGHAAYYRAGDGVLISGDAVLTVNLNSIRGILRGAQEVAPAPRYTMWNWQLAVQSIATLAAVRPRVLASGHGRPLASDTALALHALACRLARHGHVEPNT